jgi:hypothetical protein
MILPEVSVALIVIALSILWTAWALERWNGEE